MTKLRLLMLRVDIIFETLHLMYVIVPHDWQWFCYCCLCEFYFTYLFVILCYFNLSV